jgi:hypothetical protein
MFTKILHETIVFTISNDSLTVKVEDEDLDGTSSQSQINLYHPKIVLLWNHLFKQKQTGKLKKCSTTKLSVRTQPCLLGPEGQLVLILGRSTHT